MSPRLPLLQQSTRPYAWREWFEAQGLQAANDMAGPRLELFSMLVGSGLSVLLLNALFRFGAKGDEERREEEEARDYYSAHGHWPDEAPPPR